MHLYYVVRKTVRGRVKAVEKVRTVNESELQNSKKDANERMNVVLLTTNGYWDADHLYIGY